MWPLSNLNRTKDNLNKHKMKLHRKYDIENRQQRTTTVSVVFSTYIWEWAIANLFARHFHYGKQRLTAWYLHFNYVFEIHIFFKWRHTILDCMFPTQPSNGSMCIPNGTLCVENEPHLGHSVISGTPVDVACESGFTLFGAASLMCQTDGEWNFHVGSCKKGMIDYSP